MTKKSLKTQQNILNSARFHFLKKGFAGTSMGQIAQEAGVTKALLFHYFHTKEELWQQVKDCILGGEETIRQVKEEIQADTFEDFLTSILDLRFKLYARNPDLIRMMMWQRCESEKTSIKGTKALPANIWESAFKTYQDKGMISPLTNLKILTDLIYTLSAMPFLESLEWIYEEGPRETYKYKIKDMLLTFAQEGDIQK